MALALGRALALSGRDRLRDLATGDRQLLLRLVEQVSLIAARLERLEQDRERSRADRFEAPALAFRGAEEPLVLGTARSRRERLPEPRQVRRILRQRQQRATFLGADLFADPAWDMLLDLTAARGEGKRVSVTSLCIAAAVGAAADFNRGRRTSVRVPNLAAAEGDFNDYQQAIARGEDPTRGPEPPASTGDDTACERRSPRPALRPPDEVDREAALYEMDAGVRAAKEAERRARLRFRRAQAAQRQLRKRSKPDRVTAVREELRLAGEAWQAAKAAAVVALKNRRVMA